MMVASKFLYDDGEDGVYNDEWADSAGQYGIRDSEASIFSRVLDSIIRSVDRYKRLTLWLSGITAPAQLNATVQTCNWPC